MEADEGAAARAALPPAGCVRASLCASVSPVVRDVTGTPHRVLGNVKASVQNGAGAGQRRRVSSPPAPSTDSRRRWRCWRMRQMCHGPPPATAW